MFKRANSPQRNWMCEGQHFGVYLSMTTCGVFMSEGLGESTSAISLSQGHLPVSTKNAISSGKDIMMNRVLQGLKLKVHLSMIRVGADFSHPLPALSRLSACGT